MEHSTRDYRTSGFKLLLAALLVPIALGVWWNRSRYEGRAQRASNERNAATLLRVLAAAQEQVRDGDVDGNGVRDYWTQDVAGLCKLGGPGRAAPLQHIPADLAAADAARPGSKPRNGYYYKAIPPAEKTGFAFCAYPADYNRTGRWTFVINETKTVYRVDTGGKPVIRWAPDPETWKLLD